MTKTPISIWFFIGVLLAAYGVLITAAGIYELFTPPARAVVLGELHAAGLHAAAGEHLRLDDDGAADALGDALGLLRVAREAVIGDRDAGAPYDLARLVFEEPQGMTCLWGTTGGRGA